MHYPPPARGSIPDRPQYRKKCVDRESNPGHLIGSQVFWPLNYRRSVVLSLKSKPATRFELVTS